MDTPVAEKIIVDVETVDQVFNDGDANPFAVGESVILGGAALERILTQLQIRPLRSWVGVQLIVRLPEEQITPDLQRRLATAIHRYCAARIEDNRLQVRLSRKQHLVGLIAVMALVITVILVVTWLFTNVFTDASSTILAVVMGSISLFSWVIIWGPLESLLFDWTPLARENRALAHVMNMHVVVEKQS